MPHRAAPAAVPTDSPISPKPVAVPKPPQDDEPPQSPVPVHKDPPAPDLPARPAGPAAGRPQPPRVPSPVPLRRLFGGGAREERHNDAYVIRHWKWGDQEKESAPRRKARRRSIEEDVRPLAREGKREIGGVALRARPPLEPAVGQDRQPITLEESLRMLQDLREQLEKEKKLSNSAVRALGKAKRDLGKMEVLLRQTLSDCQDAMVKATDELIRLT